MKILQKARSFIIARYLGTGFLLFTFLAHPALAQSNVKNVIEDLDRGTRYMPETLELVAYLMGLFCLYSAIVALKEFSQEPEKKPFKPALIRFIIAAMLIALPQTIKTVMNSFSANPNGLSTMQRPTLIQGLN
jgi:glycerol uptake facilitator-like aquaporin